jgi:hypothetical protein
MFCRNWNSEDGKKRWPGFMARVMGGIVMAIVFTTVFGLVVQYLWNWLMPSLFHLAEIDYYQAFGLMILARLLIGGFGHRRGHHGHYRHMGKHGYNKSCKSGEYENWQHYDAWWNAEGKDAFKKYADSQK